MPLRYLPISSAALCLAAATMLVGAGAASAQGGPVDGVYTLIEDPTAEIMAAISTATDPLNFVYRPIVRRLLRSRTLPPPGRVEIATSEGAATIRVDEHPPTTALLDGEPVAWRRADMRIGAGRVGEMIRLSAQPVEGGIVQVMQVRDGRRVNRFTLSPDGRHLSLDVTIEMSRLAHPIEYRLLYRRNP